MKEVVQIEGIKDPKIRAASDRFEVSSLFAKKVKKLSGGERKRLRLSLTLFKNPDRRRADERNGLSGGSDLLAQERLSPKKRAYLVAHCFEELHRWANKFPILQKGKPVFFGTVKDLEDRCPFLLLYPLPQARGGIRGPARS